MKSKQITLGRCFALNVEQGEEVREAITRFCAENAVRTAIIPSLVGAVSSAKLITPGDPASVEEDNVTHVLEPCEIEGNGHVCLKDAKPLVHLHVTLSKPDAKCTGGHLVKATALFLVALFVIEVKEEIKAVQDKKTKAFVWDI